MALNFPLNPTDGTPYIDPVSGLKYIFNQAIGGWETAIQPPVIVTQDSNSPDINIDGFLWYDSSTQILYVLRGGTWTAITGSGGGGGGSISVGPTAPSTPVQGDLWWDSIGGTMYIYYIDGTSNQWVIASPNVGGETNTNIFTGPSAPGDPVVGTAWYNTIDGVLYIYTGGNPPWKPALAPVDGVSQVTGLAPIVVNNTDIDKPVISITPANTISQGTVRFATQAEVSSVSNVEAAITPGRLGAGIDNYLPEATTTKKGVVELATAQEAAAGTDASKVITPATLSVAVSTSGNPPGTVIAFAGEQAPSGYLVCDGSLIQNLPSQTIQGITADFRNLRTVLGTSFSSNNTDVLLPDLRGEFIRGYSSGRLGVDSGRAFGSNQAQSIESHDHSGPAGPADTENTGTIYGGGNRTGETGIYTTNASGSTETRPRNVALLYCIKF